MATAPLAALLLAGLAACGDDDGTTLDTLASEVSTLATSEVTLDSTLASTLDSTLESTLDSIVDSIPTGSEVDQRLGTASQALRNGDFTTMLSALNLSGLGDELEGRAATLLAPTDEAFTALSSGDLADLVTNPTEMDDVLRRHVLDDAYTLDELRSMTSVTTISGDTLPVTPSGDTVTIGGATLSELDMGSGTGGTDGERELMVYGIDAVLLEG